MKTRERDRGQRAYRTIAEVAKRQDRSEKSVRRDIEARRLAAYRFGGVWRISDDDLEAYEALRRQPARP